jgi:6-phosphogluconolactonase
MTIQTVHWQPLPDTTAFNQAVVEVVLDTARAAIAARGTFCIVLAGGSTPEAVYARLAACQSDWDKWQVYFGDERCLPAGDPQRNDSMARRAWLDCVPIPPENVHAIPAELGPEAAARRYAETLSGVGNFDLVLLGLGEDGHTASLFPGQPLGASIDSPAVLAVQAAPKPPAARVSLSAARLSRARRALFLVTGAGKRVALAAWRQGQELPARHIAPPGGVEVLFDASAGDAGG